jgi:hypothetical protein
MTPDPWTSQPFRLAHANIRGTPKMSADKVEHDLEIIAGRAGIITLVEFKWRDYWRRLGKVLGMVLPGMKRERSEHKWRSFPGLARGIASPVAAGQMIAWKGARWRRRRAKTWMLHKGRAGISEDRRIRGCVLEDRPTRLCLVPLVTHNVVGGDRRGDGQQRQDILREEDIPQIVKAVRWALRTGWPVALTLDGNIAADSAAFTLFERTVVDRFGGTIVGEPGIEYVIVYPGRNGTMLEIDDAWTIKPRHRGGVLWTDHEVRGITGRLVAPRP